MEDHDILIEALREEGVEPTPEEVSHLDAELTLIAAVLFDYFINQKRHGRKISHPYPSDERTNEGDHLLSSINKRTGRRHKP